MNIPDYLAMERDSLEKHDYYFGRLIAMAGASPWHNDIKDNLIGELHARLKSGPCRTRSSDQRVRIDEQGHYAYPDIVIICDQPIYDPLDSHTLINPTVVIEILSDSTERYDRKEKVVSYRRLDGLREIILVTPTDVHVERFIRRDDGQWTWHITTESNDPFEITSLGISIPMEDVYRGVDFQKQQ